MLSILTYNFIRYTILYDSDYDGGGYHHEVSGVRRVHLPRAGDSRQRADGGVH